MSFFVWNDHKYSVGVHSIDTQHKKLVGIVNTLFDHMKAGKAHDIMEKTLSELIDYVKEHFTYEEGLQKKAGYPRLIKHAIEHQDLMKKVADFQKQFSEGQVRLSVDMMNFLKHWLEHHIAVADKDYSKIMQENGIH
ncbi:MAG: bacteriohemerythrin [Thermoguttaceae bacterium]